MSDAAQIEFIKVLPSIILAIVVVGLVIWLRHPLREKLLPRVSGIKLMWFEVTLIQQDVDRSEQAALALTNLISPTADEADQLARWHGFDKAAQEQLVKRAHRIAPVLRGASVLWVDDRPQFNNSQRNILSRFGISIDIVTSTNEALALVCRPDATTNYDLIISDIARPAEGIEEAGLALLETLRKQCYRSPVVFYVGDLKPGLPEGAFGICDRAGELFRLTFNALEKSRAHCAAAVVTTDLTPTQPWDV